MYTRNFDENLKSYTVISWKMSIYDKYSIAKISKKDETPAEKVTEIIE